MKKVRFGVLAGAIALFLAFSSANTLAFADEEAEAKGNVVIEDEDWDANTVSDPVVLNNVTAKELIVESGNSNVLKINGGNIDTVSVVLPKMDVIGYDQIVELLKLGMPVDEVAQMYRNYLDERAQVNELKPTIKLGGDAVIEEMVVSSGATLNLAGGEVKEVVVNNNNNNSDMLTLTIQNYDGKVTVDQKTNKDGSANRITVNLKNSNLSELAVAGQDNCSFFIEGDKTSDVATVNVNGAANMVMNVQAKDIVVAEDAEKSEVRVYSDVENVVVNADNCLFSVAISATVQNAIVDGDNVKVRYTGSVENAEINGTGSDISWTPVVQPPKPTKAPTPTPTPKPEGTVVGNEDCSTPWWSAFSKDYSVEEGTSETITFWNYTSGRENFHNFLVILKDVDTAKEYAVLRADNWGWLNADASNILPDGNKQSNWNWDTYKTDMDGAKVELTVTNKGNTADVKANITTKAGKKYYQNYTGIAITDGALDFCLTVEGGYLIVQEPVTGETETPETPETPVEPTPIVLGAEDCSTGWWTVFSDAVKVESGTTETVTFKNYTSGVEFYHNFAVILKNVSTNKEYAVTRADNWGWLDGDATKTIADANKASNWNWDTMKSDLNGATVELTITNNGTTADVEANITTATGAQYFQRYTGIAIDGDLYYSLTVDHSYLVIE